MKETDTGISLFEQAELPKIVLSTEEIRLFRNPDFQFRITEGAKRITDKHAESSFVVGTLRRRKTVFPLVYGTAPESPEDGMSNIRMLGYEGFAEVATFPSVEDIDKFLRKREGKQFRPFDEDEEFPIITSGTFHFHPYTSGFSGYDIEQHDEYRLASLIPEKKDELEFYPKKDYLEGLFFPIFKRSFPGKPMVALGYIAISGFPDSTEYQGADYTRLSPAQQVMLFGHCGFAVSYTVIPVVSGTPQFNSYKNRNVRLAGNF